MTTTASSGASLRAAAALAALWAAACGPDGVILDSPTGAPSPTADAEGDIPEPFSFTTVGAAYVGVSGSYPYMLLYEDEISCAQLTEDGGAALADTTYQNILILVGGWDEGTYPIFDVIGATGAYSLDGQAIAYLTTRTGRTINELEYARAGSLEVSKISELLQTVRGTFDIHFESGTLSGEFSVSDYCDVY